MSIYGQKKRITNCKLSTIKIVTQYYDKEVFNLQQYFRTFNLFDYKYYLLKYNRK